MAKGRFGKLCRMALGAAAAYWLVQRYKKAKAECPPFERTIYDGPWRAVSLFAELWERPEQVTALFTDLDMAPELAQKILVAVAGRHGGTVPHFGGLGASLTKGLSEEDVNSLLSGKTTAVTVADAPALAYAQHYLERQGQPDRDMVDNLVATYGEAKARALTTFVRIGIMVSLVGNTFDALVSRALGQPAPGSTLQEELKTLLTFFFGILPLTPVLIARAVWQMPEVQEQLAQDR